MSKLQKSRTVAVVLNGVFRLRAAGKLAGGATLKASACAPAVPHRPEQDACNPRGRKQVRTRKTGLSTSDRVAKRDGEVPALKPLVKTMIN